MKKPLPRESFSPRASKVSMATADGLIRAHEFRKKILSGDLRNEAGEQKYERAGTLYEISLSHVWVMHRVV